MPCDLLLSARDPGGAAGLPALLRSLEDRQVNCQVVAQEPAYQILLQAGLRPQGIETAALADADQDPTELLAAARWCLEEYRPGRVVTCLSGPGIGIDEALVHLARDRAITIQDLEGWVVPGFSGPAPVYLVNSELAERLTRHRYPQLEVHVIGALKYSHYGGLTVERGAPGRQSRVTVYGQCAWGWPGYARSLAAAGRALSALGRPVSLAYRPHPKESASQADNARTLLAGGGHCSLAQGSLEESLLQADLALTCFSTCGADLVYLNRLARKPLGSLAYLWLEPELRARFQADTGLEAPWPALMGCADLLTDPLSLAERLAVNLDPVTATRYWERTQALVASPQDAAGVAADLLVRWCRPSSPPVSE